MAATLGRPSVRQVNDASLGDERRPTTRSTSGTGRGTVDQHCVNRCTGGPTDARLVATVTA